MKALYLTILGAFAFYIFGMLAAYVNSKKLEYIYGTLSLAGFVVFVVGVVGLILVVVRWGL